jgi:hypothetical protein
MKYTFFIPTFTLIERRINQSAITDIEVWCSENFRTWSTAPNSLTQSYADNVTSTLFGKTFSFFNEEDAVLFKLTWGEFII